MTSDILLKFRTKMIGLTANRSKMYREVRLDKYNITGSLSDLRL